MRYFAIEEVEAGDEFVWCGRVVKATQVEPKPHKLTKRPRHARVITINVCTQGRGPLRLHYYDDERVLIPPRSSAQLSLDHKRGLLVAAGVGVFEQGREEATKGSDV